MNRHTIPQVRGAENQDHYLGKVMNQYTKGIPDAKFLLNELVFTYYSN